MIEIRRAGIEDLDELSVLFDLYRLFYLQPSDIAAARQFLSDRLTRNESVVFVAVRKNALAGFIQLYPIFSSVSLKKAWLLNDLYVHATARKNGVAAKLLEAARQFGLETKSKYLLLETRKDNFAAQSVYEKNGWVKVQEYFYELDL